MRKIKRLAVLTMAVAMIFTGCGKSESVSKQDSGAVKNYSSNTKNADIQEKTTTSREMQKVYITTYEELEKYQNSRMEKIKNAYEGCGMKYGITPNQCFIYNLTESYEILEKEYEVKQIAYSLYDKEQNVLNTVIDYELEFHPEKGVASGEKYIELLYALIQTTENENLKEKFPTSDVLATEIANGIGIGEDYFVLNTDSCRLKVTAKTSSKYVLEFVNLESCICEIQSEKPIYKEFDSLEDYEAYIELNMCDIVDTSKYKVWDGSQDSFSLIRLGEEETPYTFVLIQRNNILESYGIDNNFALVVESNLGTSDLIEENTEEALAVITQALKYMDIPGIDTEKVAIEMRSYDVIYHITMINDFVSGEWYGVTPRVDQYSCMRRGSVMVPIKVEGMLNR